MSSAAGLNAISSVVSGHGLAANVALISQITQFQNNDTLTLLSNIYATASTYSSVASLAIPEIDKLAGNTVIMGQWLLDAYPSNISPAYSGTIRAWAANTNISTNSLMSYNGHIYNVTGNVFAESFDANVTSNSDMIGFSEVIKRQSQIAFANGIAGFANVFLTAQGYASSVLDTVGSIYMLRDKTYGQSGLGYTGITDLVTGGVGTHAALLGNTVANWGTMYDITNLNLIDDPYVFGQNLLNQGLGGYGNLSDKLAATGLDITDITKVPSSRSTTTQEDNTLTTTSFVGQIELPIVSNVTTTTTVTGNSPAVVMAVYKTITGADLQAIVSATGFKSTSTSLTTLADYLNFSKIVNVDLVTPLTELGLTTFQEFSTYLHSRIGQGRFTTWKKIGEYLNSVEVPDLKYTTTTSLGQVLLPSTISTLSAITGSGTGPFGNPTMLDYFGTTAGIPYTETFKLLNNNRATLITPITPKLQQLEQAIIACNNHYVSTTVPDSAIPPAPPNGDGVDGEVIVTDIIAKVTDINNTLNALNSVSAYECQTNFLQMLNNVSIEVANLQKAGVVFDAGQSRMVMSFAQQIPSLGGKDTSGLETNVIIKNLIAADVYGDTIRSAIAEHNNSTNLSSGAAGFSNDPNPIMVIVQANQQNIPITTYISRNK